MTIIELLEAIKNRKPLDTIKGDSFSGSREGSNK